MLKTAFVLLLVVGAYFLGFNTVAVQEKIITNNLTYEKIIVNGTECTSLRHVNISKVKYEVRVQNLSIDISDKQKNDLINLKPKKCNTVACSEGYFKSKYDMFDILGFKRPKFSERSSAGVYNVISGKTYNESLPIYEDGFGKYVELDPDYWFLFKGELEPFNKSLILENQNLTSNLTALIEELNQSEIFFTRQTNESTIRARKI